MTAKLVPTATHWGLFNAEVVDGRVVGLHPYRDDPDPSPIGRSLAGITDHACRIDRPMVRAGYLSKGPTAENNRRGAEPFVAVSWEQALDLAAGALAAVRDRHGNQAIYGGSYGWASAGRFHHAQGQLRRFLNLFGGCTTSVNTYSTAAADVILGRVLAPKNQLFAETWSWREIASHSDLVLSFGGLPLKNAQVNPGGLGRHETAQGLRGCRRAGVRFVNVSPIRDDMADFVEAEHLAPGPTATRRSCSGWPTACWTKACRMTSFSPPIAPGSRCSGAT